MSITSADVAREAGVSRATVSYVLNDVAGKTITEATRAKVLAAADTLGYRPNVMARSLKRGHTGTLVLPMPGHELNFVMNKILSTLTEPLAELGLKVVPDFTRRADPAEQVEAWLALAPAAVLDLMLPHADPALALLKSLGVPVLSDAARNEPGWESSGDAFARDQRLLQLRYLIEQGHERILTIYPRQLPIDRRALRTLQSGQQAMAKKAGVTLEVLRLELDELADAILALEELPAAIACHNDEYALVALTALQRRSVRVPQQVAVMGIDDLPICSVVSPAITTIRPDLVSYAHAVVEVVRAALANDGQVRALPPVEHQVVQRETA